MAVDDVQDLGETPAGGTARMTIRKTADGIGVYNPTRRKIGLILFMIVWLGGWSVGEFFALTEIFGGGSPFPADIFLMFWVTAWTFGGVIVWSVVAWQLFGVEKLFLIDGGAVVVERGFGPLKRRKVYPVEKVTEVGFAPPAAKSAADGFLSRGRVRFFVDGKPAGFGIELDDKEAGQVIDLMTRFIERHTVEAPKAIEPGDEAAATA
ncbi:hypothetical protein ABGN05_15115 [Aquibium sp. LZ166]|uniref:PH domain-containing protein n=1 Tax=Aquibium pacificus TaxID=3153579 RepID=A0ABV3SJN9_9HYPH